MIYILRSRTLLWGILCLALVPPPDARAVAFTVHPAVPLVTPGTHLKLRIEAQDDSGNPLPLPSVTWSVIAGSGAATITPDGILTGVSPGTLTLTAQTNLGPATAHAYVLSPIAGVRLAVPNVVADPGQPVYLPLILSSSPDFTDVQATLRFVAPPGAPPLAPTSIQAPDGTTLSESASTPDGFRFHFHWAAPIHGPLVLGTALVNPPANLPADVSFTVQLADISISDASGAPIPATTESGTLVARAAQPGPAAHLTVTPAAAAVAVGDVTRFETLATDAAGNEVTDLSMTWSVDPPDVGTIGPTGAFTAAAAGKATVKATSGSLTATASVTVTAGAPPAPEILVVPAVDADAGTTVTVPVLLGEVTGLAGATFDVRVQAPAGAPPLTLLDPQTGPLASGTFLGSNVQPDGSLAVAMLAATDIDGPGVLASLQFQVPPSAPGGATYAVSLDSLDLSDGNGEPVPGAAVAGEIDIRPDTTPPTVTVSGLPSGFVAGSIPLTVSSSDNTGVTRVELWIDGRVAATVSGPPYSLSWDTTAIPDGTHTLQVRAYDPSGNMGFTPVVTVIVDNTRPAAAITAPASGAGLKGSVAILGTAADANLLSYRLQATLADGSASPVDIAGPFTQSITGGQLANWNTPGVPDGAYVLHLVVADKAGNVSEATVPVVVANAAPQVDFAGPPASAVKGTIGLTLEATNGVPLSEADFSIDGSPPIRVVVPPFTLALDTTQLSNGTHTVKGTGVNGAGAAGDATLTLVVDNGAPALSLLSPADGARVHGKVSLQVSLSDATATTLVVDFGAGSAPGTFTPAATVTVQPGSAPGPIVWDTGALPEGLYLLRVTATNAAGTSAQATARVTVDNTPPDLLVNAPQGEVWAAASVAVDLNGGDAGGIASITAAIDGMEVARTTTSSLRQTIALGGIPEGSHTLAFAASDTAGNVQTVSAPLHIDRTPPMAAIASPLLNAPLSGDVTVIGTAQDPAPGQLAGYQLQIGAGGSPSAWQPVGQGTAAVVNGALGTFSVVGLPSGTYTVRLIATDQAGNTSESRVPVSVGVATAPGDVNSDGKINVVDATLTLRAAVGLLTLDASQFAAADVNHDGKVDVADATLVLRLAVGLP